MTNRILNNLSLLILFGFSLLINSGAWAQDTPMVPDFEHFYEDVTQQKLSQLYWRLGKFDIDDDMAVDNYLRINECDIYQEYKYNQFEWNGIRKKARVYLRNNIDSFPERFKYEQPLLLREYDPETQQFEIHPKYRIDGARKFELYSLDFYESPCGQVSTHRIYDVEGYPNALLLELNQPLTLTEIPVDHRIAKKYIEERMKTFLELPENRRSREAVYSFREAFIVIKIRVFSYKGTETITNGRTRATVYAMLEGYEIYADPEHEQLLYYQNYMRKAEQTPVEVRLKEQFEALKRKRGQ